ncbi:biliverdin-producing heme oxygenase [Actinomadura sp. 9N407]|uniref:biliverdin-producing heme oxygenase n=1 Tax=Actinomadura sp. 9N407 TaxID=3375154 RepID=UPI00379E945B
MTQGPFTEDVVGAIARHMNDDHADDSLLIVQMLGGLPEATSVVMTGMDADGVDFSAQVDDSPEPVRIPWSERLTERSQVRAEVVRMHGEAKRLHEQSEPFSTRLRTATRPEHGDTEQSAYMTALLDGRLSRDQYAALVEQLYFVYDVLEEATDHMRDDEVAGRFDLPGLRRRAALQADLAFYYGPDWASRIRPNDATRRYCARLREVCFDWPAGFVAHHYTRYLGDLSGGQAIGRRVARTYGLTGADGVRFYRFEAKPKQLKDRYRELLDAAPWNEDERARFIDEVRAAYQLNADLAEDLSGELLDPHVTGRPGSRT